MHVLSLISSVLTVLLTASVSAKGGKHEDSSVDIKKGNGTIQAKLASGDSVMVYLHGATVTSWKTSDGDEKIWLSTASPLNGSAAIRGGIPVVFPNFGTPPKNHSTSKMPSHGFARNSTWTFASSKDVKDGISLTFTLDSSQLTAKYQKGWPFSANLTYTVNLMPNKLSAHFEVVNTDTTPIEFQFLLHSYLTVPNISLATVEGLKGGIYQDKTLNYTVFREKSDQLQIVKETDRIYTPVSVGSPIILNIDGKPRVTVKREKNLPDVTIWNLWSEKALVMDDFAPKDAWQNYLAIEPGSVVNFTSIAPGKKWEGGVMYSH